MALKTVPFNVAFTFSRPDPADYEDINGDTQTAGTDVPRFNYSEGVGEGLMLDASLSEIAAINDIPNFNSSSGTWVIKADLDKSKPIPGSGFGEFMEGSGTLVFVYSNGVGKCWADGQVLFTVDPFSAAEPGFLSNGGLAKVQDLTYYPYAWTDEEAAAKSSGAFSTYFTPVKLFSGGEQGAWYDPSDLSTLFQDAAGTTPVTSDGDPVGLMLDKSGNNNHASQSTTAAKPVYRTDGTLHWLELDGVDDRLSVPVAAQGGAGDSNSVFTASIHDGVSGFYLLGNTNDLGVMMLHSATGFRATAEVVSGGHMVGSVSGLFAQGEKVVATSLFDRPSGAVELGLGSGYSDQESFTPENKVLPAASAIGIRGAQVINLFGGAVYGLIIVNRLADNDEVLAAQQHLSEMIGD